MINKIPHLLVVLITWFGCCKAQPQISLQTVASGLTRPVKITHANDDRIFVAEIGGKIRILKNGKVLKEPFLNIGSKINDPDWAGIFSIAFDPSYQTNGYFYVMYVAGNRTVVEVSRFSRNDANPDMANSNSEQKILTIPYTDVLGGHRGGDMAFGKDGYLYVSTGDNGPGSRGVTGDPENNAQDPGKLFGKLLRLNVNGPLPLDAATDAVFALGLRNPWRFSIDRLTGDFWIGDNGQDGWEEINYLKYPFQVLVPNFGWSCLEGNQSYTGAHCTPGSTYQPPKAVYPGYANNGGLTASVMGGYVYRGSRYSSLTGYYFFGDYTSGKIGFIDPSGNLTAQSGLSCSSLISFGEDQSGELYLLSFSNGTLSKLTSPDDPLPARLIYFRLNAPESSSLLEWQTAAESNFAYFEIQRSPDGRNFEIVQQIKALGAGYRYSFSDQTFCRDFCYYRLKMVDLDGFYAYSKIIAVFDIKSKGYLQVDETPIKVLESDKKGACHQGWYWVYHSPLDNVTLFDYQPTRGSDGVKGVSVRKRQTV